MAFIPYHLCFIFTKFSIYKFSVPIFLDKDAGKTTYSFLFRHTGWKVKNSPDSLYDVAAQSVEYQRQTEDQSYEEALHTKRQKDNSALGLLVSAYGNSSDSEEDQVDPGIAVDDHEPNVISRPSGTISQKEISCLPSHFQDCNASAVRVHEDYMQSAKSEGCDTTSGTAFKNTRAVPHCTFNCSQDIHDAGTSMFGNTAVPIDKKNASLLAQSDEDSSRLHVFCLEHAAEVEQQLRPIGGAQILLLCHPGVVVDRFTIPTNSF